MEVVREGLSDKVIGEQRADEEVVAISKKKLPGRRKDRNEVLNRFMF